MFSFRVMGLGSKLRELRLAKGWTLEKLEEVSGVNRGTIHALEARDSSRSVYFSQLAKSLGSSYGELVGDIHAGPEEALVGNQLLQLAEDQPAGGLAYVGNAIRSPSMQPILSWEHEDDLPPGEFVMVPRLEVTLSAGPGSGSNQVEIQFNEAQPQAFRAEWVRAQRLKPKKLAAMTADGSSMEPTIHDGDSLLIDTSQTEVIDGKVYALWYEGGERVKRLYRMPGGGLRIRSDNSVDHPEIVLGPEYLGHVRIIGRVVHRSGTGGL